jgi:hypothetical protein
MLIRLFVILILMFDLLLGTGFPALAAGTPSETRNESAFGLPYSNQWVYERAGSFLYLSYQSETLATPTMAIGSYRSDFGSAQFSYPAVDFFGHILSLAPPESDSIRRDFSIWGRYSLGFANRTASLNNTQTEIDSNLERSSLLIFSSRVSALLSFDHWTWLKPYFGIEANPYYFRNTATLSGAEKQGENWTYGPVLGAHIPILFENRGSLMAEWRSSKAPDGSGQILGSGTHFAFGAGLSF